MSLRREKYSRLKFYNTAYRGVKRRIAVFDFNLVRKYAMNFLVG